MNTLTKREGSQLQRTVRPSMLVSALAAATTLIMAWGKIVLIGGFAIATPWLALAVFCLMYLVLNTGIWVHDKVADAREQQAAAESLEGQDEVRRIERIPDAPIPPGTPAPA